jgi:hypothetical protein
LDTIATVTVVPEAPPPKSCLVPVAQPLRASAAPPAVPARKARRDSGVAGEKWVLDPASRSRVIARPVITCGRSFEQPALKSPKRIVNTLGLLLDKVKTDL